MHVVCRPPMKRIAIVGASSDIARHCAMLWLAQGEVEMLLVGRDRDRMAALRERLRAQGGACAIEAAIVDFHDSAAIGAMAASLAAGGPLDIVLIAHGAYPDQLACQADLGQCRSALEINAISPVLFAEAFAGHMQAAGQGTLALIGSLAGDRGRKSNYVYGAAKGMLARYAQGLQHRFAGSGVRVVLIKPGPVDTPMTAVAKAGGTRVAPVAHVARDIVDGIARGRPVVYTPGRWRFIMLALIHLPRRVFNRLDI